jgi:hypothetical protein
LLAFPVSINGADDNAPKFGSPLTQHDAQGRSPNYFRTPTRRLSDDFWSTPSCSPDSDDEAEIRDASVSGDPTSNLNASSMEAISNRALKVVHHNATTMPMLEQPGIGVVPSKKSGAVHQRPPPVNITDPRFFAPFAVMPADAPTYGRLCTQGLPKQYLSFSHGYALKTVPGGAQPQPKGSIACQSPAQECHRGDESTNDSRLSKPVPKCDAVKNASKSGSQLSLDGSPDSLVYSDDSIYSDTEPVGLAFLLDEQDLWDLSDDDLFPSSAGTVHDTTEGESNTFQAPLELSAAGGESIPNNEQGLWDLSDDDLFPSSAGTVHDTTEGESSAFPAPLDLNAVGGNEGTLECANSPRGPSSPHSHMHKLQCTNPPQDPPQQGQPGDQDDNSFVDDSGTFADDETVAGQSNSSPILDLMGSSTSTGHAKSIDWSVLENLDDSLSANDKATSDRLSAVFVESASVAANNEHSQNQGTQAGAAGDARVQPMQARPQRPQRRKEMTQQGVKRRNKSYIFPKGVTWNEAKRCLKAQLYIHGETVAVYDLHVPKGTEAAQFDLLVKKVQAAYEIADKKLKQSMVDKRTGRAKPRISNEKLRKHVKETMMATAAEV